MLHKVCHCHHRYHCNVVVIVTEFFFIVFFPANGKQRVEKKTQENRDQNVNQRQKKMWTTNYINNKRS